MPRQHPQHSKPFGCESPPTRTVGGGPNPVELYRGPCDLSAAELNPAGTSSSAMALICMEPMTVGTEELVALLDPKSVETEFMVEFVPKAPVGKPPVCRGPMIVDVDEAIGSPEPKTGVWPEELNKELRCRPPP
mmetsp:Transcript_39279/g.113573  ORF Transcript_39279/g.113573 Transcript_39279/m.113573 type:complete len:134 (+) Transcript_39279:72-473(+)